VAAPDWILPVFIFAFGCCIGSFLNVVVYRLPRDKSLVTPPSACPACGGYIMFYDNIPLVSWLVLGAKCRYCKAPISPRYFIIELLTGAVFVGLYFIYFRFGLRSGMESFFGGGWFVYLIHISLIACLIAASAIDLELWVIPMAICWFATAVGLAGSAVAGYIIDPQLIRGYYLLPTTSDLVFKEATVASLALGSTIGLGISMVLTAAGVIKRSYESAPAEGENLACNQEKQDQRQFNHRLEVCREILFLLPIIICAWAALEISRTNLTISTWWVNFSQHPFIAGLMGSLWGYFVGCAIVWATRILGTLGFGKEAMGLGDVHLMGAAGAVVGPVSVVVAFFIAPFFGLAWAGVQSLSKKIRQIPYGPFLSLGVFAVMILHDSIFNFLARMFYR
jgi:leader peptidase (prepilin peptidase)/N-methyltransferase